ncbi:hypothetical protein LCGC14_0968440 [marine sediment metagenome]|uniref:Uncharacterized protein n=1 Tax=marine sediment metagenome TaxID=412755 RepID=A0A0F9NGW6_9ZZZZ
MARRGTRIKIAEIEEFNGSFSKFCKNKTEKLKGRPTKVVLRLLKYGIEKGWFEPKKIYKALIWFGFDSDYINDVFLAKTTFEYLFQDRSFKKEENLKKLAEDDEDA